MTELLERLERATLCGLCRGAGNHFCMQNGRCEWWACQACGGAGVRAQFGPAAFTRATSRDPAGTEE